MKLIRLGLGLWLGLVVYFFQAPQEKCLKCSKLFGIDVLGDHVKSCGKTMEDTDDDDDFLPERTYRHHRPNTSMHPTYLLVAQPLGN